MKLVANVDLMAFNVVIAGCGDIDNPNFCIIFLKIELKCDTCILGGLYIVIMYNDFRVLSLKSAVINSTPKFVIIVLFINDKLSSLSTIVPCSS